MQVGLIGLPQAGKKTLMRLLAGVDASASASNGEAIPGICPVCDRRLRDDLAQRNAGQQLHIVQLSATIEADFSQLDDPNERADCMKELGITEPAIDGLTRVSYEALGRVSYFTIGPDGVVQDGDILSFRFNT